MLVHNAAIETIEELYILGSPCNFVDSIIDKINNRLQVQTLHIKYITFGNYEHIWWDTFTKVAS